MASNHTNFEPLCDAAHDRLADLLLRVLAGKPIGGTVDMEGRGDEAIALEDRGRHLVPQRVGQGDDGRAVAADAEGFAVRVAGQVAQRVAPPTSPPEP